MDDLIYEILTERCNDSSTCNDSLTVLSGERVSQMTKTYSDVDAVQRLLEEKEKDLELAARIGQQLLEQNQILEEKVSYLETENKESKESIAQLKHELTFKSQLLELYDESCASEENSKAGTPIGSVATLLERRVAMLEEENQLLRSETSRIAEDVEKTEAEEKCLVEDAIKRLGETNSRMTLISDELQKKTEEHANQQDEIIMLVDEVKAMQEMNKDLYEENSELQKIVEILKSSQSELSAELLDLRDNYIEVVDILKETQEQLREAQKRKESGADVISVFDSLAYEIESSVARQRQASDYFRRCFDTVRCANQKITGGSLSSSAMLSSTSSGYNSGSAGLPSLESTGNQEMLVLVTSPNPSFTASELGSSMSMCSPGSSTPDKIGWRIPEKLQIIKPREGSSTLQVWSSLANPHLGTLLESRPGVLMRMERTGCLLNSDSLGMIRQNLLAITGTGSTLQNFTSTPAVFTFVTTSTNWDRRRDSTTTVYTGELSSTFSTYSLSSRGCSPTPSTHTSVRSGDLDYCKGYDMGLGFEKCETPQNSPCEGNSRPSSPVPSHSKDFNNRSFGSLCNMYDALITKLGRLGGQSSPSSQFIKQRKDGLMSKAGSADAVFAESRQQAPVKPGTGVLDKILAES